jgi:hypothetical protein
MLKLENSTNDESSDQFRTHARARFWFYSDVGNFSK